MQILTEEDVDALRASLDADCTLLDVTAGEVERAWFDGWALGRAGVALGVIPPGVVGEHYQDGWAAGASEAERTESGPVFGPVGDDEIPW